jgi:arylsulfatase A-like enzyme
MNKSNRTRPSRSRLLLSILMGLLGAALLTALALLIFSPHDLVNLPLLAELPKAEVLGNGTVLNMDGEQAESFFLTGGFADPTPSDEAEDRWCRDVAAQFNLHFTRWQLENISLRFRIAPLADTREMTLVLNGKPGQTVYLEPGYHDVTFPLPNDALAAGDNMVDFHLKGGENPGAVIDTVRWEVGGEAAGTGLSMAKRSVGEKTLPVLGGNGSAEADFYLEVPAGARLVLGLGHDRSDLNGSPGRLQIFGRNEAYAGKVIWEGDFPASGTRNLIVDLGELAGSLSLLSFYLKPNTNIDDWLFIAEPRLEYPKSEQKPITSNPSPPTLRQKHPRTIVIICEDAMRRDFLPVYGRKTISTPNLDNIAKTALVFDNAYSPSSWTKHVFASIYTAQPGGVNGATKHEYMLRDSLPSLVELFQKNHWRTAIITGNPYTSREFGLNKGFTDFVYINQAELDSFKRVGKIYAEGYIPYLSRWLGSLAPGEDALLVLHLMDTHTPYQPPPGFKEQYSGVTAGILKEISRESQYLPQVANDKLMEQLAQYCGSITYFDSQLPEILEQFYKVGREEGTTFILFSDHGEEFLDHGGIKHGFTLYQEMIHIPLLMWGEGVAPGRSEEFVNLEDLLPTLLDLAGIKVPAGLEGVSYAAVLGGTDAGWNRRQFAETEQNNPGFISLTWQGFKLMIRGNLNAAPGQENAPLARSMQAREDYYQLYDLANDSQERNNLSASNPIRVGFYKGYLMEWWAGAHRGKPGEAKIAKINPDTIEQLKGLGYVE